MSSPTSLSQNQIDYIVCQGMYSMKCLRGMWFLGLMISVHFTFAAVLLVSCTGILEEKKKKRTSRTGASGFELGRQIHSLIVKHNYESHIFVGSSFLDMYAKAGKILDARGVFESLPERDVVSCTSIISGCAQLGLDEEALELFRRLQREGMSSNHVTYASLLTAFSGLAALNHGKQVRNHFARCEMPFYVVLQNSLIDMSSKCENLIYSRRIFDTKPKRTVISWNAMLVGFSSGRSQGWVKGSIGHF
ncbi:putative pentatricopeptide repeat-containing protein At3g13770, mitochondrial [Hevea brasiliensis]|uniref:putative pentatricopeptide repeat-containing protein At3g13770, mitochondrial n=1 Tax=Hevea brasiliensis TaxID=3981 RepID=UPI0025EF01F3|nr:putative pentatricopeptide repeat-containing protein At3g13770, mitochondrial [Hevea brasiliensis]